MSRRGVVVALTVLLLSGQAPGEARVADGAGTSRAATSPTASDPSPSQSLPERLLQRARQYRGNPLWLGIVTGALLVIALGFGIVTLGTSARSRS